MLVVNLSFTADSAISSSPCTGTTTSSDLVGHITCGDNGYRILLVMVLETAMTTRPRLRMLLMMNVMMATKRKMVMVMVMVMRAEDNDLMIGLWLVVIMTSAVTARSIAITFPKGPCT